VGCSSSPIDSGSGRAYTASSPVLEPRNISLVRCEMSAEVTMNLCGVGDNRRAEYRIGSSFSRNMNECSVNADAPTDVVMT